MATVRGLPVDRPPVCFYEINGYSEDPSDPDPFNIYSHPSWAPLIELARDRSDRIVMGGVPFVDAPVDPVAELTTIEEHSDGNGSLHTIRTIRAPGRVLRSCYRRDRDVNTYWATEHLIKDAGDLKAFLELPESAFGARPDVSRALEIEAALGDTGIFMVDTADPLCMVAGMCDMATFTVLAFTERDLIHRALERFARIMQPQTEAVAEALPGRLWRIFGPEYASPPYLPPSLFEEYVVRYDTPMVEAIHRHGGFARIHSHGNLRDILDHICATGCMGLDPVEPPPQGDVELAYVRERYGRQMVLFGNIEASDIVNLKPAEFGKKVARALDEGTRGDGRGFVLMPSACPYGRVLETQALKNYEKMVELTERF